MRSLRERLVDVPRVGVLRWIGVRPAHGVPVEERREVLAIEGRGLDGDVAAKGRVGGNRQVTLMQEEHFAVIASLVGVSEVGPAQLRRNLVVSGVNLLALAKLRFAIGDVVLEGTGACAPCAQMDVTIAPGGFQAVRGHGGITARVVTGGPLQLGMPVRSLGRP